MRSCSFFWLTCALSVVGCGAGEESPAEPATSTTEASSAVSDDAGESPSVADPSPAIKQSDGKLGLERLTFAVPDGWEQKEASSSFVLAEYRLPKADGDDADGRLTVSVAGGTVEANIDRWRDQFGGKPEKVSEQRKEINGLDIAVVDFSGEFDDQRGPFAPATKRSGYRMLAAIISADRELHFVKAVGPEATIAAHADRFQEFIGSVTTK